MSDAWGGFRNGCIPLSAMYPVQVVHYLKPDVAHALIAAIAEAGRHGIKVSINEAYRPLGIPADSLIPGNHPERTSTHGSNQHFQAGRARRKETPTAAVPGQSVHGFGKAVDLTPGRDGGAQYVAIMKAHGFVFDIPSESWHARFVGLPARTPEPSLLQKRSWKGLQKYLKAYWGYSGAIDGLAGGGTWTACQKWLAAHWLYKGACDGIPGPQTYAALTRAGVKLR